MISKIEKQLKKKKRNNKYMKKQIQQQKGSGFCKAELFGLENGKKQSDDESKMSEISKAKK